MWYPWKASHNPSFIIVSINSVSPIFSILKWIACGETCSLVLASNYLWFSILYFEIQMLLILILIHLDLQCKLVFLLEYQFHCCLSPGIDSSPIKTWPIIVSLISEDLIFDLLITSFITTEPNSSLGIFLRAFPNEPTAVLVASYNFV